MLQVVRILKCFCYYCSRLHRLNSIGTNNWNYNDQIAACNWNMLLSFNRYITRFSFSTEKSFSLNGFTSFGWGYFLEFRKLIWIVVTRLKLFKFSFKCDFSTKKVFIFICYSLLIFHVFSILFIFLWFFSIFLWFFLVFPQLFWFAYLKLLSFKSTTMKRAIFS